MTQSGMYSKNFNDC